MACCYVHVVRLLLHIFSFLSVFIGYCILLCTVSGGLDEVSNICVCLRVCSYLLKLLLYFFNCYCVLYQLLHFRVPFKIWLGTTDGN